MRKLYVVMASLCLALGTVAQTDSSKTPVHDTIRVGNLIIVKTGDGKYEKGNNIEITRRRQHRENISTNWGILDLGFANFTDNTNYASAPAQLMAPGGNSNWFKLRSGKSVNVNLWLFMQRINVIAHVVNLKYGVGLELNNYTFDNPVRFNKLTGTWGLDLLHQYHKNKLAADYLTVPAMLDFNFTPGNSHNKSFGLSAGVSAGYLYSARQKIITHEEGKLKTHDQFDLRPFKISYIAELQLGPIKLYGSVASQSMFKDGFDQTPYTLGVRLSNW